MRKGPITLALALSWAFTLPVVAGATQVTPLREALESGIEIFDQAQQVRAAEPQRARQLFLAAAQHFESIAAAGINSGPLEYNLGSCYLQAGETGKAILHYRRAERFMPNDAKLKANLAEARQRCLTSIPPSRKSRVLQSIFFWHYQTTMGQRLFAALALYAVCWLTISARAIWRRRWLTVTATVVGLLAVVLGLSVAATDWQDRNSPAGVILDMDVTVRKGPATGYERQFEQPLQPGTEFTRRGSRSGWWEIELPDGNTGWIEASTAELIPERNS